MQFHPQPFRQGAHSGLGGAVDRPPGGEHLDPENRGYGNDVAALLLLHVGQRSWNIRSIAMSLLKSIVMKRFVLAQQPRNPIITSWLIPWFSTDEVRDHNSEFRT